MTEPERDDQPDAEPEAPGADSADAGRDPAMDALIAASRLHRGAAMDGNGEHVPLTNPEVGRIRNAADRFLAEQDRLPKDRRLTRAKLAGAIGESKSTVSQILNNKYPRSRIDGHRKRDEVLRKIDKHLALLAARRESPQRSGFAWTGVAEEVKGVANTAVLLDTIGVAYGPAGIGKTLTLEALLSVYPGSVLITIDDGTHSVTTFLRELSDKLKVGSARYRQSMRRCICDALRQSKRLVMVDEAHLAGLDVLNCIRQIHDSTGCPVLLAGLPALAKTLLQGRGDDSRGATLFSRVGVSRDLTERCRRDGDRGEPLFSVADVRKVFARSTLRIAGDAQRWLQGLACMPEVGAMRAATNAVRLATHVAQQKGDTEITLAMLQSASKLLHGLEGARAIANRIKQQSKVA